MLNADPLFIKEKLRHRDAHTVPGVFWGSEVGLGLLWQPSQGTPSPVRGKDGCCWLFSGRLLSWVDCRSWGDFGYLTGAHVCRGDWVQVETRVDGSYREPSPRDLQCLSPGGAH